jgi:hypothetical protein
MNLLYTAANLPEAYLVRGLLVAAGIEARVLNEYALGAGGELPFSEVRPEVWIEEERDIVLARRVIEAYEKTPASVGATRCPACGEDNPRDFAICWHCQRPL